MDRPISALLPLLLVVLALFVAATSAAAATIALPQDYWKKVLPDTPMPNAIRELLLRPDVLSEKATPGETTMVRPFFKYHRYTAMVRPFPSNYIDPATERQVYDDPAGAFFFLEKDLIPGGKMKLQFARTTRPAAFIPGTEADVVPFSSKNLPDVLTHFSLQPNSQAAEAVKETLQECEEPATVGETRHCATSLESMVDFATSTLGTHSIQAVSTEVGKGAKSKQQHYTVAPSGVQTLLAGGKSVSCHQRPYPHAVFYCHTTSVAKVFAVQLVGENGSKVSAVAVCHVDTSTWYRGHLAFRMLKVMPGTVPVCHFLPEDHLVWFQMNIIPVRVDLRGFS